MKCLNCNNEFEPKNKVQKFCCRKCKNEHNNKIYQSYDVQKNRGLKLKIELIKAKDGKCEICGYDNNLAALSFHHLDPSQKDLKLDARTLSNTDYNKILKEAEKCQLLCANCHMEIHYPNYNLKNHLDNTN